VKHLRLGGLLLVALVLLSGCPRKDPPPQITICIGDGFGGADCLLPSGVNEYWPPSKLENAWITTQPDMERFASWCYDVKPKYVRSEMRRLWTEAKAGAE